MGKIKDISGQRFGRLIAQYYKIIPNPRTNRNDVFWHCKCDCGNEKDIRRGDLQSGKTTSCGCYHHEKMSKLLKEDLAGQKFGRLLVLEDTGKRSHHSVIWKCQCDCGKTVEIYAPSLKNGDSCSCGCLQRENTSKRFKKDISNQRFGKLTAIEPTNRREDGSIVWKCECDCGNIIYVQVKRLVSGNTQSCGCLKSKGEQKIINILRENNINFKKEYTFPDLPKKRFDFYIPCCSICLEYDGIQHFDSSNLFYSEELVKRDREKDEYCKQNNILLIRIPYTDYNKINLSYILDKIKEKEGE